MKAHGALYGRRRKAEKVLKALAVVPPPVVVETFTKADAEKMAADAIKVANDEFEKKLSDPARQVRVIPRTSSEQVKKADSSAPIPV